MPFHIVHSWFFPRVTGHVVVKFHFGDIGLFTLNTHTARELFVFCSVHSIEQFNMLCHGCFYTQACHHTMHIKALAYTDYGSVNILECSP